MGGVCAHNKHLQCKFRYIKGGGIGGSLRGLGRANKKGEWSGWTLCPHIKGKLAMKVYIARDHSVERAWEELTRKESGLGGLCDHMSKENYLVMKA